MELPTTPDGTNPSTLGNSGTPETTLDWFNMVWSAKYPSAVKQPPLPSDNHDAIRQAPASIGRHNQLEADAGGHWPERPVGWAPVFQDPRTRAAGRRL